MVRPPAWVRDDVQSRETAWANDAGASAQIAAAMDTSVDPCQDFYRFACGRWDNRTPDALAGLSGDRLFFVAYAQNWCGESDPAVRRHAEVEDVHAPSQARVNNVLALTPAFTAAFGCSPEAPMRAKDTCDLF